jgi:membrane protein implicated in regulation of membrane protease activity
MNLQSPWTIVIFVAMLVVGAYAWYRYLKFLNSPDGERYQKMRTQGPFVPLPPEESDSRK